MAGIFACPFCGSKKIRKEQEDDEEYVCEDCLEFFPEPKIITTENKQEEGSGMDKDKLKELHALGKTDKEIGEALNCKTGTVWAARNSLGLKNNYTIKKTPKRRIDRPIKEKTTVKQTTIHKPLSDITALDMLIAERNSKQAEVFKLNQAIEILS